MATVPELRRIRLDTVKDVPPFGAMIANTFNRFAAEVVAAFSTLTFKENFAAAVQTVTTVTPADYPTGGFTPISVTNPTGGSVTGVLLLSIKNFDVPATLFLTAPVASTWATDQKTVKVNYITGLTANTKYTITLLVF